MTPGEVGEEVEKVVGWFLRVQPHAELLRMVSTPAGFNDFARLVREHVERRLRARN